MPARRRFSDTIPPVTASAGDLILEYLPLVDLVVARLLRRVGEHVMVERDDLTQAGRVALVRAAQRYNRDYGAPFGAYARRRIAGSLLDELRRVDPLSRLHRRAVTAGRVEFALVSLECVPGADD